MIEIHADKVAPGFLGGHLNQEVSRSKANFQFQRLMVPELGLPVRPFVDIKKIKILFRDFGKRNKGFCGH
jgi:homoserine kinase